MPTMVPGIAAKRVVISDKCRATHGDQEAFHRAAFELLLEYIIVTQKRAGEKGLNYHMVLTIEDTKDPAKRPTEVMKRPRGQHMASMPPPTTKALAKTPAERLKAFEAKRGPAPGPPDPPRPPTRRDWA